MNFAATWGIVNSPAVRFRTFRIRNGEYEDEFEIEQMDLILQHMETPMEQNTENFELALEYVREKEEIQESIKAILFDDEMNELSEPVSEMGNGTPLRQMCRQGRNNLHPAFRTLFQYIYLWPKWKW